MTSTNAWTVQLGSSVRQVRAPISAYSAGTVTVKGYLGVLPANPLAGNMNMIGTVPVSGTFWQSTQPISIADGSDTTVGAKADAKSTATGSTAVSAMSVLKQISASARAPPSQAVTNAGTFATLWPAGGRGRRATDPIMACNRATF
jgi:hypothetical protein